MAMEQSALKLVVYGATWCPDARRSRAFLEDREIPYTWIDIDENPEGEAFVRKTNGGEIVIPVIVFPDESVLVEPSNHQLAEKLDGIIDGR
jgi:glutaredoxin